MRKPHCSVHEMSKNTGIPTATCYRILTSLEAKHITKSEVVGKGVNAVKKYRSEKNVYTIRIADGKANMI